jgi:hypothetical protein
MSSIKFSAVRGVKTDAASSDTVCDEWVLETEAGGATEEFLIFCISIAVSSKRISAAQGLKPDGTSPQTVCDEWGLETEAGGVTTEEFWAQT